MRTMTAAVLVLLGGCGVNPAEGVWTATAGETLEDSCSTGSDTGDTGEEAEDPTFELKMNADGGSFTLAWRYVDPTSGDVMTADPTACVLDGKRFDCADRHARTDVYGDESAVLEDALDVFGTFHGGSSLEAETAYDLRCEGEACADLEELVGASYPCAMRATFTATAG